MRIFIEFGVQVSAGLDGLFYGDSLIFFFFLFLFFFVCFFLFSFLFFFLFLLESLYIREVGEGSGSMLRRGASTGGLRSRMKASLFSRRREAVLPFRDLEEVTEAASISPSQVILFFLKKYSLFL